MAGKNKNDQPQETVELETPRLTEAEPETTPVAEVGTTEAGESAEAMRQQLETTQQKAAEYLDGWQRSRAEFANYKKRIEREREQTYQMAAGNVIRRYLDVVDDLDRALKNRPQDGEGAAWAGGIELVYRKLLAALAAEGVKPIEAVGQPFDPNQHEAITHEDNPQYPSGTVIEVVQNGYALGERVLRPAVVRVAR
jgi:molecular chaperone GrpE